MNSQKTLHTSPFRASYGVSFMSTSTEIDRVIKGFYYICGLGLPTEQTMLLNKELINHNYIPWFHCILHNDMFAMLIIDEVKVNIF